MTATIEHHRKHAFATIHSANDYPADLRRGNRSHQQTIEIIAHRALVAELRAEVQALLSEEHLVACNEGTYSGSDACSVIGTADPNFANYYQYKTLGGKTRERGPSRGDAERYSRIRQYGLPKERVSLLRDMQRAVHAAKAALKALEK